MLKKSSRALLALPYVRVMAQTSNEYCLVSAPERTISGLKRAAERKASGMNRDVGTGQIIAKAVLRRNRNAALFISAN